MGRSCAAHASNGIGAKVARMLALQPQQFRNGLFNGVSRLGSVAVELSMPARGAETFGAHGDHTLVHRPTPARSVS